jgi:hypothetical protein
MLKFLTFLILLFVPISVKADLVHRLSTSTQLSVNGAATVSERIGSTYVVSGSNIKVTDDGSFGGLTAGSATAAPTMTSGTYEVDNEGEAFSFSESWTQGDGIAAIGSGVELTDGEVTNMPAYGTVTTQAAGSVGDLAGTINSQGEIELTAGGVGTQALGQFVSEITIE